MSWSGVMVRDSAPENVVSVHLVGLMFKFGRAGLEGLETVGRAASTADSGGCAGPGAAGTPGASAARMLSLPAKYRPCHSPASGSPTDTLNLNK